MNFNSKLRWIYLTGIFVILFLPLLNLPPLFSPPDWGKTIIFRIVLSILILVFLCQLLNQTRNESEARWQFIKKSKIFWSLIALFGIFLLATIFSLDRHFSLWGSPYRAGGFLNFSFLIVFALLTFSVIRKQDWQKIWDFSILVGILVCVIAIFQQFGILKEIFVFTERRPPSTIGITSALAIYLLLLSFLTLSFGIKTSWRKWFGAKKSLYFLSLILFILVSALITQTRSVYIGLIVGFFYFLFFYPIPFFSKKSIITKTLLILLLALIGFSFYFLNAHTAAERPDFIKENEVLNRMASRLSIETALEDPRMSGWPVAWQAVKDRLVLGYGPENFAIGFDKFYDPTLPELEGSGSWWDRAHNIFLDTASQAGIPAFTIYLALFVALFWQLRKLKRGYRLIAHGIQASLLGYFTANIFSFDVFSTYLIFFLIVGYSLHLLNSNREIFETVPQITKISLQQLFSKWKMLITMAFLCPLVWFVWEYNVKPFQINTQINVALHQAEKGNLEEAITVMENTLPRRSFLDNYLRLQYVSVLGQALEEAPGSAVELSYRAYQILQENTEIRPSYTRNWLLLGTYTNILIGQLKETYPETAQQLEEKADYYLFRANELSPKRQDILAEWINTDFYREDYEAAKEKAQECISYNPNFRECYCLSGLADIYLGNDQEAEESIGYCSLKSAEDLIQLANAYLKTEDYQSLAGIYQRLIKLDPENAQYRVYLATCYKILGEYEKARDQALMVYTLAAEAWESASEEEKAELEEEVAQIQAEVESFLQSLPN